MSNSKSPIHVKLRIFKGRQILKKEDGSYQNENHLVTLQYNDLRWKQTLANLVRQNVCKITVEKVFEGDKEIETPEALTKEINSLFEAKQEQLSPDQQKIKDLQERLDAIENGSAKAKTPEQLLKEARAEYKKLAGAKGDDSWTVEQINEEIEKLKNTAQ